MYEASRSEQSVLRVRARMVEVRLTGRCGLMRKTWSACICISKKTNIPYSVDQFLSWALEGSYSMMKGEAASGAPSLPARVTYV